MVVSAAVSLAACTSNNNSQSTKANTDSSRNAIQNTNATPSVSAQANSSSPVTQVVSGYLAIKNALANDDGKEAASGGKAMTLALQNLDASSLNVTQKKAYTDMADDLKENAEHIGENAGKIAHQREHFDMLSQDMYDLVKAMGSNQKLFKDSCPMYDNDKGAIWLSETKDIKNPYLGKKMPTCGSVKEEINNP